MNKQQRLKYYATAPRATVGIIAQLEGRNFIDYYVGKLRGKIVSTSKGYKFHSREDAIENARQFRLDCINELAGES